MAAPQCVAVAYFMAMVLSGVRHQRHRPSDAPLEADFVVVGGGSGGSTVAGRLSEVKHWQVLLLEAGPEEPKLSQVPALYNTFLSTAGTKYDWQMKVEPTANDHTGTLKRAKMLGGCSAHNAMVYLRGTPADYKCWVEHGATGWSFEDVLPFFKKSEDNGDPDVARDVEYHSTGGPLSVQRLPYQDANVGLLRNAYEAAGLPDVDLNGGHDEGVTWAQTTSRRGQRWSANTAFLSGPRRERANLHVVTGALVKRVRFDACKRAVAVEFTDRHGTSRTVRVRKEVILSGGTLFSPQLLMASGVGPADHLREAGIPVVEDLPAVGTNLQDHTMGKSSPVVHLNASAIVPTEEEMLRDAETFVKEGRGPLTTVGLATLVVRARSPLQCESEARPAIHVQHGPMWESEINEPFCGHAVNAGNSTACYYDRVVPSVVLLHPTDAGTVKLNVTHPFGPPLIYQKIFTNDQDVRVFAAGLKRITEALLESRALREAGATVSLPKNGAACGGHAVASQAWYECVVRVDGGSSYGHQVGTCSIGRVVDPRLRVLGVRGLRVADASVMPCVPGGNTNAPTIMVGERAADFIKRDHGVVVAA